MEDTKIVRLFRPNEYQSTAITTHTYNFLTNDWQLLKQFDCSLYFDEYACYIIHGDNFYVFDDGRREGSCRGSRINLRTGENTSIDHPKLYYMELAVVDNQVYAFGFFGYRETERVVLRFSNENNRWIFVSRTMQHFWRETFAVACLGNSIFVAGGKDDNKPCSLVECFDKSTRKWTKLPNMTIIDGSMYAIDRKITTAERYDFQRHIWENVSISGRKAKMFYPTVTVHDRLYAIERNTGQFYRIDLEDNGKKIRLVCITGNSLLSNGQYELLSMS